MIYSVKLTKSAGLVNRRFFSLDWYVRLGVKHTSVIIDWEIMKKSKVIRVVKGLCERVEALPGSVTDYGFQHNQIAAWKAGVNVPSFHRVAVLAEVSGLLDELHGAMENTEGNELKSLVEQLMSGK